MKDGIVFFIVWAFILLIWGGFSLSQNTGSYKLDPCEAGTPHWSLNC